MTAAARKVAAAVQQIRKWNVFVRWSVFKPGTPPKRIDEGRAMKGIVIAVSAVLLGTLAYITIGMALASVS
jgi:hypothetical protein